MEKTTKRPAAPSTEVILLEAITALRENPKKYQALQKALKGSKSDAQRVKQLLKYATSERQLAALIPARARGTQAALWTTVTVTTIFILEDSAY